MASDWATYAAGLDGVVASAPEEGCIEATASSLLYGFVDELAIRLKPTDGGTLVDMRSRIGKVDRGVNAKRIRACLAELHPLGWLEGQHFVAVHHPCGQRGHGG